MMNVCIIVSNIDRAIAFEWIVDGLKKDFNFSFILIGKKGSYLSKWLKKHNVPLREIEYKGKRDILKAVFQIFLYLRGRKFDVVHTHLVEATLFGLFPASLLRIKKRIYTRHHSDYNYKYNSKGIKYDRWSNYMATKIVAITEQVRKILIEKENVSQNKITLIHHGIDTKYFEEVKEEKIHEMAKKYNPNGKKPVVGIIARNTHWKGIQYAIPAFAKLLETYPNGLLILANATGDYEEEIDQLLNSYLPKESFVKILYEYEIAPLYKIFDVFVHLPIDEVVEAFGQVYVEALAAGVPCVFTLSGIALDFIKDNENARVVPHKDCDATLKAMLHLLTSSAEANRITLNGRQIVGEKFSIETFLMKLKELYVS